MCDCVDGSMNVILIVSTSLTIDQLNETKDCSERIWPLQGAMWLIVASSTYYRSPIRHLYFQHFSLGDIIVFVDAILFYEPTSALKYESGYHEEPYH